MKFATLIQTDKIRLATEQQIIKQSDYAALLTAHDLLAAIKEEVAQERLQLEAEFEAQRVAGYNAGYEDGLKDAVAEQVRLAAQTEQTQRQLESKLVKTILTVVSEILNKTDMKAFFLQTLRRVRKLLRSESQLVLKVASVDAIDVEEAVAGFIKEFELPPNFFELQLHPDWARGSCVLESPSGEINCSLPVQLSAIEEALRQSFKHSVGLSKVMPIYAYKCSSCGMSKDILRKISDPALTLCPECGQEALEKQVTAAGFQLKGSGWYASDFKGAPPTAATTPPDSIASAATAPAAASTTETST